MKIAKTAAATLMFLFAVCTPTAAEKLLVKGGSEYLGLGVVGDEFVTCDEKRIKIGSGEVKNTTEKCKKPRPTAAESRDKDRSVGAAAKKER